MTALFEAEKLEVPSEFIGQYKKSGGYTSTTPREWTEQELNWALEQRQAGYSVKQIAEALSRSEVSVQIKLKRNGKTSDTYNEPNREKKYKANLAFAELVKPRSVLDAYAGNSWWQSNGYSTVTNDIDEKFDTHYHDDSLRVLCDLYASNERFDLVDLDPYGSAYDCFDLAIKLSKKAVVVSFGEWGHKRWKRFDFVKPRYGIQSVDEYGNGERFIAEFQRIAACNKRHAEPVTVIQYSNFLRVYFTLSDIKITEQWGDK